MRPTEISLEERRLEAKQLFGTDASVSFPAPGSETKISKALVYWRNCPFGHPDDRVGESQSSILDDEALAQLADDLSIDGEVGVVFPYTRSATSSGLHGVATDSIPFFWLPSDVERISSRSFLFVACCPTHVTSRSIDISPCAIAALGVAIGIYMAAMSRIV